MKAVTRKLKSKSGISLAIALVFFLLCAMVGTVVLSAASASAGNTAKERQLYRETLALTSAAELLSQDIQTMTYTGSYTRTEIVITTVDPNENQNTKVETDEEYGRGAPAIEGSRLFSVTQNADDTYTDSLRLTERYYMNQSKLAGSTMMEEPSAQTIVFQAEEGQNIPEVEGSITVEEDYTISVELWCGENSLSMTFAPNAASRTEVDEPEVTKLGEYSTQKATVTTYSTILTWRQPLMKEGGVDYAQAP